MDAIGPDDPTAPVDGPPEAAPGGPPDVAELIAEKEALTAEVERLSTQQVSKHRLRKITAGFLVAVFALTFVASGVGIWLHRNTLNSDVWNDRVVPLGEDPAVQEALAAWTTAELMKAIKPEQLLQENLPDRAKILAVPLSAAVDQFVGDQVDKFFASKRFEELWAVAATKAHDAAISTLRGDQPAVEANSDSVTINLIPLINAILNEILTEAPGLVGSDAKLPTVSVDEIPSAARDKLAKALGVNLGDDFGTFTIYDGGKLSAAQQAVRIFDKVVVLSTFLAVVSLIGALAVSVRRRRTLLQLAGVAAVGCILIRRLVFMLQDDVNKVVKIEINRPAAAVVVKTFANPLTSGAEMVLWIIALIVVIAVLTGPYGWVRSLRTSIARLFTTATTMVGDKAQDDATLVWVAHHVDALRIGGYVVGALLLWFVDLTWVSFFLIALLVAGWQVLVARLAIRAQALVDPDEPSDTDVDSPPGPPTAETVAG